MINRGRLWSQALVAYVEQDNGRQWHLRPGSRWRRLTHGRLHDKRIGTAPRYAIALDARDAGRLGETHLVK